MLAIAAALVATGCSKKDETSPPPTGASPVPAPATPSATVSAPAAEAPEFRQNMEAEAKQKADAAAAKLAADTKAKSDAVAADAKQQLDAAAAAAKKKAEGVAMPAPVATAPAAGTAPAIPAALAVDTSAATAAAGSTIDALKAQAEQLLTQYSGELATLKSGAVTLKGLIDKNAAMLPAGVAAKYQELNALLPQLSTMVDSLKDYQSADLTTLVPKLKADFGNAQKLYAEIKGMLPAM